MGHYATMGVNIQLLALAFTMPIMAAAQTSVQNTTYNPGQTVSLAGPATLVAGSAVNVSSGATVTYYAGTSVTLKPGFTATSGSVFRAMITTGSPSSTYVLTVINGSGGGSGFLEGTQRTIVASGGGLFQNWTILTGNGTISDPYSRSTMFTFSSADATIRANFIGAVPSADDDGDGVSNGVETELGLDPNNPNDVRVFNYTYDKINQLERGPGGGYEKDAEGNIKRVKP